jgi:hypothetical protein
MTVRNLRTRLILIGTQLANPLTLLNGARHTLMTALDPFAPVANGGYREAQFSATALGPRILCAPRQRSPHSPVESL